MTLKEAITKYKDIEIDPLLTHILQQPKEFLYLHPETKLTLKQLNHLTKLIKRRQAGEPIAYIVGYKYFYGLKFKVNKHVLIPRPETEWLVERVAALVESRKSIKSKVSGLRSQVSLLDIGTGSGCIAVSLAHAFSTRSTLVGHKGAPCEIVASDISDSALKVARQNAKAHKVDVTFVQSDLFKNISGKFDIITANLPYVPQGMYELLYHNLKYEPKVAITDGGEVWDIYNRFFKALPKHLKPSGTALLEIDDGSKPDLQKMLKKLLPDWKAKFTRDLGGLWRYLELRKV